MSADMTLRQSWTYVWLLRVRLGLFYSKVNAPILYPHARNPDTYRHDGKPFTHCPWCGKKLRPLLSPPEPDHVK